MFGEASSTTTGLEKLSIDERASSLDSCCSVVSEATCCPAGGPAKRRRTPAPPTPGGALAVKAAPLKKRFRAQLRIVVPSTITDDSQGLDPGEWVDSAADGFSPLGVSPMCCEAGESGAPPAAAPLRGDAACVLGIAPLFQPSDSGSAKRTDRPTFADLMRQLEA